MLVVGRIIAGVCVGITSSLVPVYQSEIAPKEIRGRIVSLQQWAITWGILIQFFIQYGSSFVGGGPNSPTQSPNAFRIPWAVQAFPAVLLVVGLFWFPKSPRWLASKDRWDEALKVLADVHGNGDIGDPKVLAEFKEIEDNIRFEREEAVNSYKQLAAPKMLKRVILGMSIQMWSQLCGMNVMSESPPPPLRETSSPKTLRNRVNPNLTRPHPRSVLHRLRHARRRYRRPPPHRLNPIHH